MYGYRLVTEAKDKDSERPILNAWVKERAGDPLYRYGRQRGIPLDPTAQTEDIGDDSMKASELGIANLKRIVPMIGDWTFEDGEDFDQSRDLYQQAYNQFRRYCGHVIANIGGVVEISKTHDQKEAVFQHVPKEKQKRAMAFLDRHLFTTPSWLLNEELARKFEAEGMVDRISGLQSNGLNLLFNTNRLSRLSEQAALKGNSAYSVFELFEDARKSIFASGKGADLYQRNLQRLFIEKMESIIKMDNQDVDISDVKAAARGSLFALQKSLKSSKKFGTMKQMHERDMKSRIRMILDGEK